MHVVTQTGPRDGPHLLVCDSASVTLLIGTGVSLLGSGNHENTKNYMETFWGTVVERAQSEKGHSITLQVIESGGERGPRPGRKGVTRCREGWFFFCFLPRNRVVGENTTQQTFLSFANTM